MGNQARGGRKPPLGLHNDDLPYYREIGQAWRNIFGLKKELTNHSEPGTFSDWMYFHRGRLSLAARPWTPALQLELDKIRQETALKEEKQKEPSPTDRSNEKKDEAKPKPESDKPKLEPDKRNEEERAFLKWLDTNAPTSFVAWQSFDHPDFPGQKVEIGGYAPFAKANPPAHLLEELATQHGKFLTNLLGKFPRVVIRKTEAKHLGDNVHELTARLENTGYLPTALAQGVLTREVLPTRVILKLDDKQILSGQRITLLGPIEGSGGSKELRWIVHAKDHGTLDLEVISNLGGAATARFTLPRP